MTDKDKEIQQLIIEDFNDNLSKFLTKEIKHFTSHLSLDKAIKEMAKYGFVDQPDQFSSNGWQWDYWNYMIHPTIGKICLAGSGYYGGLTIAHDGY